MEKNILVSLNLNGNPLKNLAIENVVEHPATPVLGQAWLKGGELYFYDGAAVRDFSGDIKSIGVGSARLDVTSGDNGDVTLDVVINDSGTGAGDLLSAQKIISLIAAAQSGLQSNVDTLDSKVDQEILDRAAADSTLQSNIDAEEAARIAAISTEQSARVAADNTLQSNIDSEATAARSAEGALSGRLDTLEGDSATAGSVAKAVADLEASLKGAVTGSLDDLGKVETAINNLNTLVASDTGTLDTLQEIVDFIKLNRTDLDALSIAGVAGLQAALDTKIDTAGTGLEKSGQTLGIADSGVDTAQVADSAIETAKIADGNVTLSKLSSEFTPYSVDVVLSNNASGSVAATVHLKGNSQAEVSAQLYLADEPVEGAKVASNGNVYWAIAINNSGTTAGKLVITRNV
jgi:hypothetical protein